MQKIATHLKFLLSIHLTGILVFTLFRILLLVSQSAQLEAIPNHNGLLWTAFLKGLQFDNVVASYIIALPCVALLGTSLFQFYRKWLATATVWFIIVLYTIAFTLCAADIPYFAEFYKHINSSIFNWAGEQSFVVGMISKEPKYFLYLFLLLLLIVGFALLALCYKRYFYKDVRQEKRPVRVSHMAVKGAFVLVCWLVCFVGMRGRTATKSPIRVGTSYFCEYSFLNLLGQNPVFYFLNTSIGSSKYSGAKLELMDNSEAIKQAQKYLGIDSPNAELPLARMVEPTGEPTQKNVVMILMEGMSASYLKRSSPQRELMPFLDSLSEHSYYFENCYSAGIHTMNGIYASFFSFPSFFTKHPLKVGDVPLYMGFPYTLKGEGYQTAYITTHDDQFDNVGGFLYANCVQQIVSQKDYPSSRVLSNLGVPDDLMFEQSIGVLNDMAAKGKPFFTCMMTASNHSPICIPDYYKPVDGTDKEKILAYSDWALQKFFEMAKKQAWYDNTIFVLLGDHGGVVGKQTYDVPLSYNHIPLIMVSSSFSEPKVFAQPCCQMDVFPTVMGLLNESYVNNTLGVDAINNPRPYAYFCADNLAACIDDKWVYVYRVDGRESLYDYRTKNTHDFLSEYPDVVKPMKTYVLSMLQTAKYVVDKDLLSSKKLAAKPTSKLTALP